MMTRVFEVGYRGMQIPALLARSKAGQETTMVNRQTPACPCEGCNSSKGFVIRVMELEDDIHDQSSSLQCRHWAIRDPHLHWRVLGLISQDLEFDIRTPVSAHAYRDADEFSNLRTNIYFLLSSYSLY
uniref:Uncharacterized protein n=1 Tax=Sphaerodactylus townsendi TaxID=933632 RepID=A0ACB8E8X5_9SAUR